MDKKENEFLTPKSKCLEADLRQEPQHIAHQETLEKERKAQKNKKYGKLNNSDSAGMRAEKQFINIA